MIKEKKYMSPGEILETHPELAEQWTVSQLGYLLHLKLIDGYKTRRSSKLNVKDVLAVYKFRFNSKIK